MEMEMECHGLPLPVAAASPPNYDDRPSSPVGSPQTAELKTRPESTQPYLGLPSPALSDALRRQIIKQVEYYFSNENLSTDNFLVGHISRDKEGFVPLGLIASFKKMKKLTRDTSLIVDALKESSQIVVSSDGMKVKRLNPFLEIDFVDPKLCTIAVENLPDDHSVENIKQIFGEAGTIRNVYIHNPNAEREHKKCTNTEKLLSGKLYALIEYETIEAAERAVATLNNEQDWRYGMRVKLLRRKSKGEQKKKNSKEIDVMKNYNAHASDSPGHEENRSSSNQHNDEAHSEKDGDHLSKEKHRAHNWGRGRRQKYGDGHGHGTVSSSHTETTKPPPGPRMPDGTRGFAMGRGKPPSESQG